MTEVVSAVSLVERDRSVVLVVWNRHRKGWTLPGGKQEPGESLEECQARELEEETSLKTIKATRVYDAPNFYVDGGGKHVYLFRVTAIGLAHGCEEGCPVGWMAREEFLERTCFPAFYRPAFRAVPPREDEWPWK